MCLSDMYMLVFVSLMLLCVCGAGELTVVVDGTVYGLEVTRQHERKSGEDLSALLCLVAMEESLCVNISSNVTHCGGRSLHAQLSHSIPWLRSAGMFSSISRLLLWLCSGVQYVSVSVCWSRASVEQQRRCVCELE